MSKRNLKKKIDKNKIRNTAIVLVIALFMIVVYKFGFLTRTDPTAPTVTAVFKERGTEKTPLTSNLTINQDAAGKYYVVLPDKVNAYKAVRYVKTAEEPGRSAPVIDDQGLDSVEDKNIPDSDEDSNEPVDGKKSSAPQNIDKNDSNSNETNTVGGNDTNTISNTVENVSKTEENTNTVQNETEEKIENNNIKQVDSEVENKVENTENTNDLSNTTNTTNKVNAANEVSVENKVSEESAAEEVNNQAENTSENNQEEVQESDKIIDLEKINSRNLLAPENNDPSEIISTEPLRGGELPENATAYLPSAKYYLSDDEYEDKAINLEVEYDVLNIVMLDQTQIPLYKQELEYTYTSNGTTISINGYLKYGSSIQAADASVIVNGYITDDEDYTEAINLMSYDISILDVNGSAYQPRNFNQSVTVKITSATQFNNMLLGHNVWLKHFVLENYINPDTNEQEVRLNDQSVAISKKTVDSLEFITNEFSPYAVFSFNTITADEVYIDDYEKDKNEYMGLNYTENGTGRAEADFYKENVNLAQATIKYYGYDPEKEIVSVQRDFDTAEWSSTPTTPFYAYEEYGVNGDAISWTSSGVEQVGFAWFAYYVNTITLSFTTDQPIDMDHDPWSFRTVLPNNGYNLNEQQTINNNPLITMVRDGSYMNMSGDSMRGSGWTKNGNTYSVVIKLCYTDAGSAGAASWKPWDIGWTAQKATVAGYKSTFTATIYSPDEDIDTSLSWLMEFDIPNYQNFVSAKIEEVNPDMNYNYVISDDEDHIVLSSNSMNDAGWEYANKRYSFSMTVVYANDYRIATLPNNFLFRGNTKPAVGYISADPNERQNLVTYVKCLPIDANNRVTVDLIDNPFMDRPMGKGFDGWTTHKNYTITMNNQTKVQTLTTTVGESKTVEIIVYVNWADANVIFLDASRQANGTGYTISTATNSIDNARSALSRNYINATNASDRELNIVVLVGGEARGIITSYAHTFTSLYDGHDYRSDSTRLNWADNSYSVNVDLQLDFLNITGVNNYRSSVNNTTGNMNKRLVARGRNIRIGRGMMPLNVTNAGSRSTITQIQGADADILRSYRIVVETGKYSNIQMSSPSSYTINGDVTLVLGSDYDRVRNVNDQMYVYSRVTSRSGGGNATAAGTKVFSIDVKSGSICVDAFESYRTSDPNGDDFAYCGIYVGGNSSGTDYSDREIVVEGGQISNIIGGIAIASGNNSNAKTYIKVKGGDIYNIVGGAGVSTTRKDRIIQVTGGEVRYCVAGGSNGFKAGESTSLNPTGILEGNTLVYIGGDCVIGTDTSGIQLYYADAGCVFGAGCGNTTLNSSGQVNIAHVIIDGNAVINNNVYGGGNYGVAGTATGNNPDASETGTPVRTATTIDILGGTIKGSVYGGANNNGAPDNPQPIKGSSVINMKAGTVLGAIYGGCNTSGVLRGTANINITGGSLGDPEVVGDIVFGGGKGSSTNISQKAIVTITGDDDNINLYGNIYGGSALGRVSGSSYVTITDNNSVINATGDIYGGGKGNNNTSALNSRSTFVTVDGGAFPNSRVFGGCNINGIIHNDVLVKIGETNDTFVNEVYGGGNNANITADTNSDRVYLYSNATVTNVFNGGNQAGIVGNNPRGVYVEGAIVREGAYGGSNTSGTLSVTYVECYDSAKVTNVYGGGKGENTIINGNTEVIVRDNTEVTENVYGGGNAGQVNTGDTHVNIEDATVRGNVFGGGQGATATVARNTNVVVDTANITNSSDSIELGNVYGGGDLGEVEGDTNVSIIDSVVKNATYGGGNRADVVGNTSVALSDGATSTFVYGGGNAGRVSGTGRVGANGVTSSTAVSIDESQVTDTVYGGGNEGEVTGNSYVYSIDSTVGNAIFGGGKAANVGSTTVTILNSSAPTDYTTKYVYGGGDQGELTGSSTVTVSKAKIENDIYGGGNGAATQTGTNIPGRVAGNTSVRLNQGSSTSNVFGGGNGTTAVVDGNTTVIIENASTETREGDSISGHVFGGGNNGPVGGTTKVGLTNATIAESAYAAGNGETAVVGSNPYIYAEGTTTIGKSIFGGGNAAMTGDTSIPTPELDTDHPFESRYVTAIVDIAGATIGQNVYGGANSSVIQGNTVVNIGTKAIQEYYTSTEGQAFNANNKTFVKDKIDIAGTIFGGGESMDPTKPFNYDTVSVLGNVTINVNGTEYSDSDLNFHKSIFGSGNASRSTGRVKKIEIKNYGDIDNPKQAVSLQRATDVIINNSALALSGTTDSTSAHPDGFFTLNQITALKLKNNGILYLRNGANRLASFYSLVDNPSTGTEDIETVTIIDRVRGENGGVYLSKNGKIYNNAGTAVEYFIKDNKIISNSTMEPVTNVASIEHAYQYTKNVDNRIYMYSGINLNISDDEDVGSDYGEVHGMTFFGLYRNNSNSSGTGSGGETSGAGTEFGEGNSDIYTGMFNHNYSVGSDLQWADRNYTRSYVLGLHKTDPEHDILVDGFYTVYEEYGLEIPEEELITEDNFYDYDPTTYTSYITPTPENDAYYLWFAGPNQDVYYYTFNLTASKHSTLGTKELVLTGLSFPNASLTMTSVESDLVDGVGLYDKNTIPNINLDEEEVNKRFGITMKSGNSGWSMVGSTDFFSNPTTGMASYEGTNKYKIENSSTTPTLSFYFYHSNNITEELELGYYTVKMRLEYKKDALNRGFADVIIDMVLLTALYDDLGFNGAITPGNQYDLFTTTPTNITKPSSFSTYFELAEPDFYSNQVIQDFYANSYRVINTEYVLPENTTITMIDRYDNNLPKYYYYVVTAQDVQNGRNEFRFSDFKVMGSTDEMYNEMLERENYYIDSLGYEYENYIFITSFENAIYTDTPNADGSIVTNQHFRIFLRADIDGRSEILFGLLDDQIESLKYGIYDSESTIKLDAELSKTKIYLGNEVYLNVDTRYDITVKGGSRVYDTRFFGKKLGIKLSFYSKDNNDEWKIVSGAEMLGLYFELDGIRYYPSADGTTRIKIADLVSNASSSIRIGTENSSIKSDHYMIKIESFGSADGMYYGIEASDSDEVYIDIINDVYGLDVTIEQQQAIIDTATGKVLDNTVNRVGYISPDEHKLNFTVKYLSGLNNPYITISLYRRKYDDVYDNNYEKVDLQDYVEETLEEPFEIDRTPYSDPTDIEFLDSIKQFEYEYTAFDTDFIKDTVTNNMEETSFTDLELTLKDNLRTGTYKIEFMLYDTYDDVATNIVDVGGTNVARNYNFTEYEFIGESYTYIIIK